MAEETVRARLTNLLAVTDARLTRLDVDDLLNEVLERVRAILDADTAAVLLRDDATNGLIARAARGLEEEVRQGVRVPVGVGFAGSIAATRRPVRLTRVDETTVANPILWEKGIQRMLGVPIYAGDSVFGVLHVGRLAPRDFTNSDEEVLQVAAERIGAAVQSRRSAVETAAAGLLERSLLPPRLPDVEGLDFAARYVPAENRAIGGDWYDAFTLPDGSLWLITGDVAGHGLNAAVVMGRIKSALRAYALLGGGPAHVLELTDRKVDHFEMGAMATIVCARTFPPYSEWTICTAGHVPPVVHAPGLEAALAPVMPGPPLGAVRGARRTEVQLSLPPGGLLVFYTDGLVERRDEGLDVGLERLRRVVTLADPETVCRTVMHEIVGSSTPMDDIAVFVVRRDEFVETDELPARRASRRIEATSTAPRDARRFAVQAAGPLPTETRDTLELLVSELATNVVVHSKTPFGVGVTRFPDAVLVEIHDHGEGTVAARNAAPADPSGRGLAIVNALASAWGVRTQDGEAGKAVWFRLDVADDHAAALHLNAALLAVT